MSYNQKLAEKVRTELKGTKFIEKPFFGAMAFLVNGLVAVAVLNDDLVVHVGPDKLDEFLKQPNTKVYNPPAEFAKGFLEVEPEGFKTEEQLKEWIRVGVEYVKAAAKK